MMVVFEDCYLLFGFSEGLLQDGFSGVMISCGADRTGLQEGVSLGWWRKKSNTAISLNILFKAWFIFLGPSFRVYF